jgi:alkyl sulfatase BDS1-like metallo-beta-lactamase superfamily hydrolase
MKDIKDTTVLLLEHEAKENDGKDSIDLSPILRNVSTDWGYYYTFSTNLKKIQEYLQNFDMLTPEEKATVDKRIAVMLEAFEAAPKSMKWKMRAKIGPSRKWYTEVE